MPKISALLPALACAAGLYAALPAAQAAAPDYRITKTIALGAPDKWDYLAFDAASRRVVVSHGSEVTVVDSDSGAVVGHLGPINHGNGVLVANGRVYATNQDPDTLLAFDLVTLKQVAAIPVGKGPDGALYDAASRRGFVVNEDDKTVTAIDIDANKPVFTTDIGGAPEFLAAAAGKLYVNIKDHREVVRIDIASGKLDAHWPIPDCEAPHGMAVDPATHRLFSSCVNGKMVVLDTDKGAVVASLPIGKRTDAAAFDPKRKLAFSSNSEGSLSVIAEKSAGDFVSLGEVATAPGARTMALDPESGRIFLVTADIASAEPAEDGGKPTRFKFVPGSFKMLFLDPAK
ncbi:MAG TPA: YncE family protein [Magnetospirillaceae bacterium]|nr:YncE family protein [Magnetospirillaceae bacterium]